MRIALLFISAVAFLTCDPMYQYDFYIHNELPLNIKATIQIKTGTNTHTTDTFFVQSDSVRLMYSDENWGTVRTISAPSDSVAAYTALDSLCIYVNDSLLCLPQSPLDFSKWQHAGVDSGPGSSVYTFIVDSSVIQ
jgi:hypothetical protein